MSEQAGLERALEAIGRASDNGIELGEAALLLAALDRPGVPLERYRDLLAGLAGEVEVLVPEAGVAGALSEVLAARHGFAGDAQTYDDPQNANLMRVIDRKRGLPVALGILYIDVARRAGLEAEGINFPAHFLIRIGDGAMRGIVDPFDCGQSRNSAELKGLVKRFGGEAAELSPAHTERVEDRGILLRLLNNLRGRALQARDVSRGYEIARRMVMLSPLTPLLNRELALIAASANAMDDALQAAERYLLLAEGEQQSHDAANLLQRLRQQVN